ncbi:histone-like DNA-binding protein HU [Acetobacter estunensis NRIC 0472]|uniref:DNA-binding protein HU n=1 Tax=Acetobacter estunensis TaxID=104097 RepID=A0A967B9X3_9PROT|nr:HU family DNA-binding protein [Acetobacter estunensis]NHO55024.1 DNA-binding protein HU [Acetobacter estunensis]GBQ26552.1 histone-like DNA-binding protein HU [Acetobacter estunensis NRIC 0472]
MNTSELIAAIAERADLSKADARKALDATFEVITGAVKKGDAVAVKDFGKFDLRERAARKGRNPQTGETIDIAASRSLGFTAAKALKDALAS